MLLSSILNSTLTCISVLFMKPLFYVTLVFAWGKSDAVLCGCHLPNCRSVCLGSFTLKHCNVYEYM